MWWSGAGGCLGQACWAGRVDADPAGQGGVNAHLKVPALVAGMVTGADSIDSWTCCVTAGWTGSSAGFGPPSPLGTFLRPYTFGHVRQLDVAAAWFLAGLARQAPLLPGADRIAYLDIDDTVKATHGYLKQGRRLRLLHVKGLNALLAILSTPTAAPVITATRLRKGSANTRPRCDA